LVFSERRRVPPALVLLVLSPAIGELLSGSAPPAEFFNPAGFLFLAVFYGGGAIIVRELTRSWGKGWTTLLILGIAYGIVEEGLMVKSFFDPKWMDLDRLGDYGRWAGVNWVWSFGLTIYHTVFSIGIPILLVNLIFPECRAEPLISCKTFKILVGLWILAILAGCFLAFPYRAPVIPYVLTILMVIGLAIAARRMTYSLSLPEHTRAAHPFWYFFVGFISTLTFFAILWGFPSTRIHPVVAILCMAVLTVAVYWIVTNGLGRGILRSDLHQCALASGALGFLVLIAPIQELDPKRTDNTTGMMVVALATVILLVWLNRCVKHRSQTAFE